MTETQWLKCTNPRGMLRHLRGRLSDRKRRLFACACCRRIWHLFTDQRSRAAVEASERYADGLIGADGLQAARAQALRAMLDRDGKTSVERAAAWVAFDVTAPRRVTPVGRAARLLRSGWERQERLRQADLLRDLVGNPFRPVSVQPDWLAWNGGCSVKIAQAIHHDGRFADLPVLADALEEAGCTDSGILGHCRGPGGHARGCWVVDVLLGKR
jgi:hypothetical protein